MGNETLWDADVLTLREFVTNGKDYAVVGSQTIGVSGGFTFRTNSEDVNQVGAFNTLIKFDGDALHPTGEYRPNWGSLPNYGKAYYGYLPNGSGSQRNWKNDTEMKEAKEWDLEWDAQYDPNKKYVAALFECRTPIPVNEFRLRISFDTDVRDDFSLAGNVYMTCQTTRVWTMGQLDRLGYLPEEIPSVMDADYEGIYPEQDYGDSLENGYFKAIYRDGKYVNAGNYQYGDSLYILPYISTINKSIAQTSETGEQKQYYNFDRGERVADYVLIPQIEMGKDIAQLPGGAYTEVTIRDTLPEGMHYIPGSAYLGGTYIQAEEEGQQGTVEGGVHQEPEVAEQNGETILTWVLPRVLVEAGELDRIYYSCSLGNEIDPGADLQNGAQLSNEVSISTTEDQRDAAGYNRNLAQRGIGIIRLNATSFTKVVGQQLNEVSDDITYQVIHNNNAETVLHSTVVDAMPYDGDESGSSFSGSYEVSGWQLDVDRLGGISQLANFDLYYTEDTQYRDVILGDTTDLSAGTVSEDTITSQWKTLTIGSDGSVEFPSGVQPTAWALIGEIPGGRGVRVNLTLEQDDPAGGDILANRASEGHFYRTAKAYRVERSITGTAWVDENQNGGIDEQEEAFTGLSVILQQKVGGSWETAVDIYGQECRTETASDGTYSFTDLPAGTYRVLFEDGSNEEMKLADYQMTIKEAPEIADSMNSKADGVTDSSSGKLTQAKIEEIELPALEDMVVSDYKVEYQNAGFILPNGSLTVSKTVGGLLGDKTREFEIEIEIDGLDGNVDCGDYGTVEFINGKATVSLQHGESVTISNLPAGTAYRVTEPEETREGYTVTYEGDAVEGTIDGDKTVTVRNVKEYIPVSGIKFNMIPAALIILIAGGICCFLIQKKCRRKRRRVHGRNR